MEEYEVPSEMKSIVTARRKELIECVANVDHVLGEMFLSDNAPSNEDIMVSVY